MRNSYRCVIPLNLLCSPSYWEDALSIAPVRSLSVCLSVRPSRVYDLLEIGKP